MLCMGCKLRLLIFELYMDRLRPRLKRHGQQWHDVLVTCTYLHGSCAAQLPVDIARCGQCSC